MLRTQWHHCSLHLAHMARGRARFHGFIAVTVQLPARPDMLIMVRCVTASHRVAAVYTLEAAQC